MLLNIDDIASIVAYVVIDKGHSSLGLVSLIKFWNVSLCSEEAMIKIWFNKSVAFKGNKNPFKD